MATTKVINDLIDLNQTDNTTALKGCKGDNANQPQASTISVEYLVVGGGGGANGSGSGGGGAGGLSNGTIAVPNNTAVNIVIGQGGLGVLNNAYDGLPGNQGQDSGFYTIQGQGGGAGVHRGNGLPGGSGAGAGVAATTVYSGGNSVSGQGNNGGSSSATWAAGGGGGSGAVGTNGISSQAGAGGVGSDAVALGIITQANGITASIGEVNGATLNFAGGGGGGGSDAAAGGNTIGGSGGLGGGGNGSGQCTNCPGGDATLNTGGGGGGSAAATVDSAGGSGGSGVVILKYANTATETIAGSLAGGITTGTTGSCSYPTTVLALYQLNDNAVDTCNSNQYPGTWTGTESYGTGNFGKAASFSNGSGATSNYISLPSFMPTGSNSRSISMWIKTTSTAYQELFSYGSGPGTNNYFIFRLPAGGTQLGVDFYANPNDFTATNITDGNWHHCAATYDGNLAKVYYDGVLIGTRTAGSVSTGASNEKISGYQYTGSIDQVRCYNVALTADQTAMLYAENIGATKFTESSDTVLVFKGGSGTINLTDTSLPGPKVGDLRTNTDQTSDGSASAMEHYMSTGWRIMSATNVIPDLLKDASYHYNPKTITSDGAISSWADTGSINRAVYPSAFNSGSWSKVGTGQSIEYVSQPLSGGVAAKSLLAGSANMTPYSDYNSQQDYTVGGFYWIPNDYITNQEYPWLMNLQSRTTTVGYSTSPGGIYDYYDCLNFYSYRAGVSGGKSHNLVPEFYANGSGVGGSDISGGKPTGFQTWQMLTMTVNWGSPTIIKTYINGVVQDTISTSISGLGATSNSLGIGSSYYRQIRGGLYFGDQFGFMGTVKTASELVSIYNNYKGNYGL